MKGLKGWRIATIRGVDLKIHISLLLLLVYVIFVASAQFPLVVRESGVLPEMITGGPFLWGSIFAIALFLSVVLHEFGHVLVAQAQGVKVRGITLMMLGGVSEMEKMPEKPYSEFTLSVIGPIVSFGLAGLLFATREVFASSPNLSLFAFWLGRVNLVLAIFNLIPAFPLDGGRALRSFLAARQGMIRGTQNAVRISRAFAWGLGILGFLSLNIILMLIAFFVYTTASSELFMQLSRAMLTDVTAGDVGVKTPVVSDTDSLGSVAESMLRTRNTVLPVVTANGRPAVVALRDMREIPRDHWASLSIRQVMEEAPVALDVHEKIAQFMPDLASAPFGVVPLVENGSIVGIIRYADLSDILQFKALESAEKKKAA